MSILLYPILMVLLVSFMPSALMVLTLRTICAEH